MTNIIKNLFIVFTMAVPACWGQYEAGAVGGFSFPPNLTAKNATGSATTGFKSSGAFGVFVGHNAYKRLSGELRYTYLLGDLKLSRSGTETSFGATTHALHYDLLYQLTKAESRLKPYVAAGAGIRYFVGTGTEHAFQPLSDFVALTKTTEVKPLISVGAGIKYKLGVHTSMRFEICDYLGPVPTQIIAPVPGSTVTGWMHDFVPMVGIAYSF